mgnify:CR=1 FL=1
MKKFLSLVLALVMTMSLVTVSAGAKDFTDDSEITYKEAVDVISALGVVDGYSGGDFRPDDVLTRGAAAKIICNLILGPTTASALSAGTAPFKDVPVTNTFAGYITYCSQQGIISGYADGTFRPTGTLSGNAFMKMLLGALGYDSSIEGYTGPNWQVSVIKQASGIGLDDGNDEFVGSQAVTRQEAALYAFNMLQATMVEYDKKDTIVVGDITINTTSSRKDVVNNDKNESISEDNKMQFAERYFDDLKLSDGDDAFGRPSNVWTLKSDEIGTYAKDADATYTAATKISAIYADLGLSDGISKSKVTMYVDGEDVNYATDSSTKNFVKGETTKVGADGSLLNVYYDNDAETITLVLINTYVGEVGAVYKQSSTKDAYVTIKTGDGYTKPATTIKSEYKTDAFAKEDIVAYTYSKKSGDDGIQSMALAEKVTGKMSTFTTAGSVTVGGTKYDANAKSVATVKETLNGDVDNGTEVTAYLDAYGYVLYLKANTSKQYAVVLDYGAGSRLDPARVKLLFTDGTTKKVDLDKAVYMDGTTEKLATIVSGTSTAANEVSKYDIVSYTISSDGYKLTLVADAAQTFTSANDKVITNGSPAMKFAGTTLPADGETIFLTETKKSSTSNTTYSVYEGIANVPTAKMLSDDETWYAAYKKAGDSAYTVVFLLNNDKVQMSSGNKDVIFVKGNSDGKSYTKDLGYYFAYTAYLDGEKFELKSENAITEWTLGYGPQYNDKGILTSFEQKANSSASAMDVLYAATTGDTKNSVVKLGGSVYAYGKDVKVYMINVEGDVNAIDVTSIGEDANDLVWFKLNDDDIVTDLYIKVVDTAEGVDDTVAAKVTGVSATAASGTATVTVAGTGFTSGTTATYEVKMLNGATGTYVTVGTFTASYSSATALTGTFAVNAGTYYQVTCAGKTAVVLGA